MGIVEKMAEKDVSDTKEGLNQNTGTRCASCGHLDRFMFAAVP